MNQRHKAALWYARHGWTIIPIWPIRDGRCACGQPDCKSPGKHPAGHLTDDWRQSATVDQAQINAWWGELPDANLATASWLRVDVDTKHDGQEHWSQLVQAYGLPDTVHCLTPSGGEHFYFQTPAGLSLGNGRGALPTGIDIRGEGVGYTLLPPSNHLAGIYEWELSSRPDDTAIAEPPEWLVDALLEEAVALEAVSFGDTLPRLELSTWELSPVIEAAILGDRSRVDQAIITALVFAGASNDEIRAVFTYYATTGKYAEKGRQRDKYLAHSIARARVYAKQQQQREAVRVTAGNGASYHQAVQAFRARRVRV